MAACGSLQHIFENPLPENPTLIDSLSSWNQITSMKPPEQPSLTELFGELHFKENSESSPSSSAVPLYSSSSSSSLSSLIGLTPIKKLNKTHSFDYNENNNNKSSSSDSFLGTQKASYHRHSDSFSSMNSESLQLCTEGLGFESSDDVEDLKSEMNDDWQNQEEKIGSSTKISPSENICGEFRRSRTSKGAFPPPISCIGRSGKPWVCFKSYRQDGRFVLKEMRIPTQEILHACREDGRLKLHFVQPDDEILEEAEEGEEQ